MAPKSYTCLSLVIFCVSTTKHACNFKQNRIFQELLLFEEEAENRESHCFYTGKGSSKLCIGLLLMAFYTYCKLLLIFEKKKKAATGSFGSKSETRGIRASKLCTGFF